MTQYTIIKGLQHEGMDLRQEEGGVVPQKLQEYLPVDLLLKF